MNQNIADRLESIKKFRLPRWSELPEIELYSDQVIIFIEKYLGGLFGGGEKFITASMVHNYVKLQLMPKPEKKRYGRAHIAYLLIITVLKQVLVISDIRDGIIQKILENSGTEAAYNLFCDELEYAIKIMLSETLGCQAERIGAGDGLIAVRMATYAFASKMLTQIIICLEAGKGFETIKR